MLTLGLLMRELISELGEFCREIEREISADVETD